MYESEYTVRAATLLALRFELHVPKRLVRNSGRSGHETAYEILPLSWLTCLEKSFTLISRLGKMIVPVTMPQSLMVISDMSISSTSERFWLHDLSLARVLRTRCGMRLFCLQGKPIRTWAPSSREWRTFDSHVRDGVCTVWLPPTKM